MNDQPYRPSLLRVLRKSVADAWLHLAFFVAANVIWVILLALPLGLVGAVGALPRHPALAVAASALAFLALAAGNAVLFRITSSIAHGDPTVRDVLTAFARDFRGSFVLLLIGALVAAMAAFDVYFYLHGPLSGAVWRIIGFIWGYALLMFALVVVYSYPLLVEQRRGALNAIKRSALLFLDNPIYTVGLAAALVLFLLIVIAPALYALPVLTGLSALALCFIAAGFVALAANNALLELLRKYEAGE